MCRRSKYMWFYLTYNTHSTCTLNVDLPCILYCKVQHRNQLYAMLAAVGQIIGKISV